MISDPQSLHSLLTTKPPWFRVEIDRPDNPAGEWWLDISAGDFSMSVSWRPGRGFGIYSDDADFGSKPAEIYADAVDASNRISSLAGLLQKAETLSVPVDRG